MGDWSGLFHGVHIDYSMESIVDMPAFHTESSGIHLEWYWIPHGIHDDYGIRKQLRPQLMLIPWTPHGIPDGFHGFQVDSIWNNLGKVKTLVLFSWCRKILYALCSGKAILSMALISQASREVKAAKWNRWIFFNLAGLLHSGLDVSTMYTKHWWLLCAFFWGWLNTSYIGGKSLLCQRLNTGTSLYVVGEVFIELLSCLTGMGLGRIPYIARPWFHNPRFWWQEPPRHHYDQLHSKVYNNIYCLIICHDPQWGQGFHLVSQCTLWLVAQPGCTIFKVKNHSTHNKTLNPASSHPKL